jgi:hypothetical protein
VGIRTTVGPILGLLYPGIRGTRQRHPNLDSITLLCYSSLAVDTYVPSQSGPSPW